MTRGAASLAFASMLIVLLAGCGEPTQAFAIRVRARTEGTPMPGVQISEGGLFLGETDGSGAVYLVTERPSGSGVDLVARCPDGYRARPEQVRRTLRAWRGAGDQPAPPLEVEFSCEQRIGTLVVVVETGEQGLAVRVNGQEVTRTSEAGLAHVLVRDAPGARVVISVDTSTRPELAPQNPERAFTIEHGEVAYWQRGFELPPPEREPTRRGRGRGRGSPGTSGRSGPVRIR